MLQKLILRLEVSFNSATITYFRFAQKPILRGWRWHHSNQQQATETHPSFVTSFNSATITHSRMLQKPILRLWHHSIQQPYSCMRQKPILCLPDLQYRWHNPQMLHRCSGPQPTPQKRTSQKTICHTSAQYRNPNSAIHSFITTHPYHREASPGMLFSNHSISVIIGNWCPWKQWSPNRHQHIFKKRSLIRSNWWPDPL